VEKSVNSRRKIEEFKAWAREHAIALELPVNCDRNLAKLAALDESLGEKRIAYVGEPDHFIHQKYDYRLLVMRYLIARGFSNVGEEMGVSDGHRINRFFATGDATHLDRAPIYGFKGDQRTDREDKPTGLLGDAYSAAYPLIEFATEQKNFARDLRALAGARVNFFGFDIDAIPGGGYADISEILRPYENAAAVARILARLNRAAGESLDDEIARLDAAVEMIDVNLEALSNIVSADDAARVARYACSLRDSFRYIQMAFPAKTWAALNTAMAYRETVMHRHASDAIAGAGPGGKIALMSHNLHLAKDFSRVRGVVGAGPGGGKVDAVGMYLNKLAGGDVFSIWMLINRGRDCQSFWFCTSEINPIAGTMNAALAEIAPALILPLAALKTSGLEEDELRIQMDGNAGITTAIARQADAIVFIDEVSPLRLGDRRGVSPSYLR
jgi:erythromycin esterase-like protein